MFGKLLVKDNRRSVFAFADVAFQLLRLLESKPERGAVVARPKQQNIDATIGLAGVEVAREWAACETRRLPRLLPRNHASLEAGNDAVGNGLVDARPDCLVSVFFIAFAPSFLLFTSALKRGMYMPNASWRRRG